MAESPSEYNEWIINQNFIHDVHGMLTFYYTHNTMWYQCNSAILYRLNWIVRVWAGIFSCSREQSDAITPEHSAERASSVRSPNGWAFADKHTAFERCDWCSLSTVCSARMVANRSVFVVHGIRFLESFLDMIQLLCRSSHAQHKDTQASFVRSQYPDNGSFHNKHHTHTRTHSTMPWNVLMKFQLTTAENINYDIA